MTSRESPPRRLQEPFLGPGGSVFLLNDRQPLFRIPKEGAPAQMDARGVGAKGGPFVWVVQHLVDGCPTNYRWLETRQRRAAATLRPAVAPGLHRWHVPDVSKVDPFRWSTSFWFPLTVNRAQPPSQRFLCVCVCFCFFEGGLTLLVGSETATLGGPTKGNTTDVYRVAC